MIFQNQNCSNAPHDPQSHDDSTTTNRASTKQEAMSDNRTILLQQPEPSFHDNKQQNQQAITQNQQAIMQNQQAILMQNQQAIMQNQQVKMTAAATLATSYCNLLEWLAMCACRGGVS